MRRLVFTTLVLLTLTVIGSGQPTAGPLAGEQLHQFQQNRELLENLVEHGVELANADTPVAKVRACYAATRDLGRAMKEAADRDDADRVVELSDHLTAVIRFGLAPTVTDARKAIPVGTPAHAVLAELTAEAAADAERFELAIPALGKVGTSAKVKDSRGKLHDARGLIAVEK